MERRTSAKPYWKAVANFPHHKEEIDRLPRKYYKILAQYSFTKGKYLHDEADFLSVLFSIARRPSFCPAANF